MAESEGQCRKRNHPEIISIFFSVWKRGKDNLHSIQHQKLVLFPHQRATPAAGHLGDTRNSGPSA